MIEIGPNLLTLMQHIGTFSVTVLVLVGIYKILTSR